MPKYNPEIGKRLRCAAQELDECLALLTETYRDESNFLRENIVEAIGNVVLAETQFEENQNNFKSPWQPRCSFCKKYESQVLSLVQGPGVQICSSCIEICSNSISAHGK